ncbi:MAG: glycoside hydrolase family 25 protein [Flammeovirgaceae bacterium]
MATKEKVSKEKKKKPSKPISPAKRTFIAVVALPLLLLVGIMFLSAQLEKHEEAFGIRLPKGYEVHGIDVSHYQGVIDWNKISTYNKSGKKVTFAFIKATEGHTIVDLHFERNWKATKELGIIRGAYHFYRPEESVEKQAEAYLKNVKTEKGDLPPVIDLEITSGKSSKEIAMGAKKWMEIVEENTCMKPIIYTNSRFYNKHLSGLFPNNIIWIARYEQSSISLKDSMEWSFWQHSENGTIEGIEGKVDLNVFRGKKEDLLNLVFDSCQIVNLK